jgi:FlaG/FlaF family flagellin (archaellin)
MKSNLLAGQQASGEGIQVVKVMKKRRTRERRRGVTPIIATILLVSIAVTVTVAVAFWQGNAVGRHTQFEHLVRQNAICSVNAGNWTIALKVKNAGMTDAHLTNLFLNGEEVDTYDAVDSGYTFADEWATNMTQTEIIRSGETREIVVYLDPDRPDSTLSPGTLVEITMHSAGGMDYFTLVTLV